MKAMCCCCVACILVFTLPAQGGLKNVEHIGAEQRASRDRITSGIVRYDRREWSATLHWKDSVTDLGEVREDHIDEAGLPLPDTQDTNVFTFQRDREDFRWKLFRENTRNLDDMDPKIVNKYSLDYVLSTHFENGVSETRSGQHGKDKWNYYLEESDWRTAALQGYPEDIWSWGTTIIMTDPSCPIPDEVDKNAEVRTTKEGNTEVILRFVPGAEVHGIYLRSLYEPINQGRYTRMVRYAVSNELGETERGKHLVAAEEYFSEFKDFEGIRLPTRKVVKVYSYLPKGDGFARGIKYLSEIVLTDVQLNVPVTDADLEVPMEEGDHVYNFLGEGKVVEFIVGQADHE